MNEQRVFLQLRAHIDDLLHEGATITEREPLQLTQGDHVYLIACGMLVGEEPAEAQRVFVQLRSYVDELLAKGAQIISRDPLQLSHEGRIYEIASGMLVGEEPQGTQRVFVQLRAYIDELLDKGAVITDREPLQLASGNKQYVVAHGMLIGEE